MIRLFLLFKKLSASAQTKICLTDFAILGLFFYYDFKCFRQKFVQHPVGRSILYISKLWRISLVVNATMDEVMTRVLRYVIKTWYSQFLVSSSNCLSHYKIQGTIHSATIGKNEGSINPRITNVFHLEFD